MRARKVFRYVATLLSLSFLASCNNGGNRYADLYQDKAVCVDGDITLTFRDLHETKNYGTDTYSVYFYLDLLSKNPKPIEYKMTSFKFIRESDNAEYSVVGYGNQSTRKLECDIKTSMSFTTTLPTSVSVEKYHFFINGNGVDYRYHLYNKDNGGSSNPGQGEPGQPVYFTVTFQVDGETVKTQTVKSGGTVSANWIYDTPDYQYYVATWRDSSGQQFTSSTKITRDITLIGEKVSNFQLATTSSDAYTFVNKINRVPSDGTVVLLEKYLDKEICLGNYAIYNNGNVKEVYLSKTLHYIYNSNFSKCGNLKTIYFAGTKEEWDAIPTSFVEIPETINIVYNTPYKY